MQTKNELALILKDDMLLIPSDFTHLCETDSNIYKQLITEKKYEIQSEVNANILESFVNYWISKEDPNITPENISEYEKLSNEFNFMKNVIQYYKNIFNDQEYLGFEEEENCNDDIKNNAIIDFDGFRFLINDDDKTAILIENISSRDDILIPKSIEYNFNEYIIIAIGKGAFRSSRKIKSVHFQKDSELKQIGKYAFANSSITAISIPSHVSLIEEGAFYGCHKLEKFELPMNSELKSISPLVFFDSSLNSFNIPSKLSNLEERSCFKLPNLTKLSISPVNMNLSYYDENFIIAKSDVDQSYNILIMARRNIKKARIPSFINRIAPYAFDECKQLVEVIFTDNSELQIIDKNAFSNTLIETITIPSSVKEICEKAFINCSKLKKVIFQNDSELELIGKNAFSECAIENIFIPSHVKCIENSAFSYCSKLKTVEFTEDSELKVIGSYSFSKSSIENISMPSHLTDICNDAFTGCNKLKSVKFSDNSELKSIGKYAFFSSSIECISIPSSVFELNEKWCCETKFLNNITIIPQKVQNIQYFNDSFILGKSNQDDEVFDILIFARRDIQTAVIPHFIKKIAAYGFNECKNLKNVIFEPNSELVAIEKHAFSNSSLNEIIIPQHAVYIGQYAFSECMQLKSIKFAKNSELQFIDESAFFNSSIENFLIPSLVTRIGEKAFSECKNLKNIDFEDDSNLHFIDQYAFYKAGINKISIPEKVAHIGLNAFSICSNLQTIDFPENEEYCSIDDELFSFSAVQNISIPSYVEEFKESWCYEASKLINFTINPQNKNFMSYDDIFIIGKSNIESDEFDVIFFARRDIEEATIPSFIKKIAPFAFYKCCLLQKVEFEQYSELEIIDKNAFSKTLIEKITIPPKVTSIAENAFSECLQLKKVDFVNNSEIKYIDKYAFYGSPIEVISIPQQLRDIVQLNF